ncbi:MAG: histidinol dehydrogenase, partial [Candidatus Competibacteraceae bacterium]|nr:histidinol dehydrogenase [Candidatus Competibacteraceae bacterium]
MPTIQRLNTTDANFWQRLESLTAWEGVADEAVTATVREILAQVRQRGDDALLEYTRRFDRLALERASNLEISVARREQALMSLPTTQRTALETAATRIRAYA